MMVKRLTKRWDTYVKEADRDPVELELTDGSVITIPFPRKRTIDIVNKGGRSDDDAFVVGLLGKEQGQRLLADAVDAPAGALQRMLGDVMVEFGLWTKNPFDPDEDDDGDEEGNSPGSSTS